MGRSPSHKKVRTGPKKTEKVVSCVKQFPDCPPEPNDANCSLCPLYKK